MVASWSQPSTIQLTSLLSLSTIIYKPSTVSLVSTGTWCRDVSRVEVLLSSHAPTLVRAPIGLIDLLVLVSGTSTHPPLAPCHLLNYFTDRLIILVVLLVLLHLWHCKSLMTKPQMPRATQSCLCFSTHRHNTTLQLFPLIVTFLIVRYIIYATCSNQGTSNVILSMFYMYFPHLSICNVLV